MVSHSGDSIQFDSVCGNLLIVWRYVMSEEELNAKFDEFIDKVLNLYETEMNKPNA